MDDLEFRRTIYADPNCTDENVRRAAEEDPAKQEFWNELKALDAQMDKAAKVPVPEDLANKLILQQSMQEFAERKRRNRIFIALAASVALTVGVSYNLWKTATPVNMTDDVLAHVYGSIAYELSANGDIPLTQVNAQLARFGATFSDSIGRVFSSNYCTVNNVKSLHLVIEGEYGRVSVFVLPSDLSDELEPQFADEQFAGRSLALDNAKMIVISDKGEPLDKVSNKLKERMTFSA